MTNKFVGISAMFKRKVSNPSAVHIREIIGSRRGRYIGRITLFMALAALGPTVLGSVRQFSEGTPRWELFTIKPCEESVGQRAGPMTLSPGRLRMVCTSVYPNLLITAYYMFAGGHGRPPSAAADAPPIKGGPGWIQSERFTIEAKAEGTPSKEVMLGPMLATLIEDGFKLKMHRESREIHTYGLIVAKGGARLKPFQEGHCIPPQQDSVFIPGESSPVPAEQRCTLNSKPLGSNTLLTATGLTLDQFAEFLRFYLDRPILNRTEISGRYDFQMEFWQDPSMLTIPGVQPPPPPDNPGGPSIFQALQRLGLQLKSDKGLGESFVIDSIQRPQL